MKKLMTSIRYKLPMLTLMLLAGVYSFAQDATGSSQSSTTHTTTTTTAPDTTTMWYTSPWVWVIGGVVLLIILIAAFSGKNKSTSEVTRTTRVTTEVKND